MPNQLLPSTMDDPRFGMDTLNPAKRLGQHVWQLLENTFPGLSGKPRNGINDTVVSEVALGYGTKAVYLRPPAMHFSAGGKEFFFCWHKNANTNDEWGLEVWNATDNERTLLLSADFNQTEVQFGMLKLYNAIYVVMEYEMATNHNNAYRTRNKILEYNTATSAWEVREMGIDIAPNPSPIGIYDYNVGFGEWWAAHGYWYTRHSHACLVFQNKIWLIGGSNGLVGNPIGVSSEVWYSEDGGSTWKVATLNAAFGMLAAFVALVYDNKMWVIGGMNNDGQAVDDVYNSTDGITWTLVTGSAAFGERCSAGGCVFNNKMWVVGGLSNSGNVDSVYYSTDGETWTQSVAVAFGVYHFHEGAVVSYGAYMYAYGVNDGTPPLTGLYNGIYRSGDGVTWMLIATKVPDYEIYSELLGYSVIVYQNKMWLVGDTDCYYSTDGINWTTVTETDGPPNIFGALIEWDNKMYFLGGIRVGTENAIYTSSTGAAWAEQPRGLPQNKYVNFAWTFVRRTDAASKLASYANYVFAPWRTIDGEQLVGPDEKLLTGTVSLSGTALTGTDAAFDAELAVNDYIRISYVATAYKVTAIADATHATVENDAGDSHTDQKFSRLPLVGDAITVSTFHPGVCEGIEDVDTRQLVYVGSTEDYGIPVITIPDVADAVAQGATHLRLYRTLVDADATIAEGLTLNFCTDYQISNDNYTSGKKVVSEISDAALIGETNTLEVVGHTVPPQGRYLCYSNNAAVLFIGGNPDNEGYWFHSAQPGNTRYPEKYASLFKTAAEDDAYYIVCDPSDGQKDTGAIELAGDLYFFKQRKIFKLNAGDPFNNKPECISYTIGCACPHTLRVVDIPKIGGLCALFISESGPAMLSPGGSIRLLTEFTIAELWPGNTGILRKSTGVSTNWMSRNKVYGTFWKDSYWVFSGDSRESNDISTHTCFAFHFGTDPNSIGPCQMTWPQHNGVTIYEPLMLVPVDSVTAYTFQHKTKQNGETVRYRLTRFLDPVKFQDTFNEVTLAYNMKHKTRYCFVGPAEYNRAHGVDQAVAFIEFNDTAGLTITITADGSRLQSANTFSQVRQSGAAADNTVRHFINCVCREGLFGSFYDVLTDKVVPSTGAVEFFGVLLIVDADPSIEPPVEFTSGAAAQSGATTFVVEADAAGGEVDAYA